MKTVLRNVFQGILAFLYKCSKENESETNSASEAATVLPLACELARREPDRALHGTGTTGQD